MSTSCAPHPSRVASDFFRFIGEEDMAGVMSLLGPEFRLRDGDGSVLGTRSDMPAMLGWDFEADPELEVGQMRVSGDTVRLTVVEENDFTRLLDLDPWRSRVTLVVRDGLIREEVLEEPAGEERSFSEDFARAIEPILAWAEQHDPARHAEIVGPDGMSFDGPTARRLLAVIRAYQRALLTGG